MRAARIQPDQIRAIHAIKTRVRLDEASYRAMLQGFGVASSKDMSAADADRLLARMREIPGASRPVERAAKPSAPAGPYARKLQALWIALYNLGQVRDRTDKAMHAFVERQTGIPHTRFLRAPADASAAIEALKGWLVRAGVALPDRSGDPGLDRMAYKRAVLVAQWRRGLAIGAVKALGATEEDGLERYVGAIARGSARALGALDCPSLTPEELDKASAALGRKLRAALPGGTS